MHRRGFTLLELLITIGILAVLATTAVLIINPVEYLKQSRDTKRIGDLDTLYKALQLFTVQNMGATPLGVASIVYISLPDTSSTCGSYTLPALPTPWQYQCTTSANLKKVDGTGWLPIDFTSLYGGSPLATLPTEPANIATNAQYYAFVTDGQKYELFSIMESNDNVLGGRTDKASKDSGDDFTRYEVGTNLILAPWSFEFTAFPIVANNSKQPGWYKNAGPGTVTVQGDAQTPNFIQANGQVWYGWQENIPYDPNSIYKLECRARQILDPTVGGKSTYCGFNGVAADGVTLVSVSGSNSYGSQHYRAFSGTSLTVAAGWTVATGYTSGYGAPNGTSGTCTNPAAPCVVHANVRYIRPMFLLNYSVGDGIANLDYIKITKQ
ncbi:MAG: hypothetical protein ACD_81C00195G0002 [uncultured bacterium]|uniref:Prepilin-type N-terminal cleavage/methylation domain-containing protein n=1 Tax=Candidatus Wolfebacteria bacterium GW2011_GWE2_44_13 TaxID=1619017 RepID=A0A0G1H805_9BACT|nr:MAG: hypothetical protein ACD_81C00195G0002 [uncultured bacterium]KKT43531.1 MAG: hypothetical protein UW32_C0001G0123 [Candidatus Wolfebacteria bacterium GW2011_GWE2_44_13]